MNYLMIVSVDTNDGDYETNDEILTQHLYEKYKALAERIKAARPVPTDKESWRDNRPPVEMYANDFTPEEIEMIEDLCPGCEYGFHTIESFKFYPLSGDCQTVGTNCRWEMQ